MALTDAELLRLREKVEVLTGERGDGTKRALRAGKIATLTVPEPAARAIAIAPTAADYNLLVADIAKLRAMIDVIRRG
jgi:hypothetical protein